MGFIYPPRELTPKEWAKAGCRDIEFEKWARYANGLGPFLWIWDWLRGDLISEKNKRHDRLGGKI